MLSIDSRINCLPLRPSAFGLPHNVVIPIRLRFSAGYKKESRSIVSSFVTDVAVVSIDILKFRQFRKTVQIFLESGLYSLLVNVTLFKGVFQIVKEFCF